MRRALVDDWGGSPELPRIASRALSLAAIGLAVGCGAEVREPIGAPARATGAPVAPAHRDPGAPVAVDLRAPAMQEAVFSADGRRAASVDAAPYGVSFFDVDRREFVGHAAPPVDRPYASTPVFAPNGDLLVTAMTSMLAESRATARYDSRTGALESTWTGELRGVVTVDGAPRAVLLDPRAGQIELHALTTPELPVIKITTPKEVRDVVVARGLVVVSTLESIRAFDLRGREVWAHAEGDASLNVAQGAGALVRERGDGVYVLDLATGDERRVVPAAKPVPEDGRPSFGNTAPEAAPFVVAKLAGKLALVDIGPAPRAPIVIGDEAQPFAVAPGARFVVTASATGAVSLVDVARRSIEGIGSVTGRVERLCVSVDGATLAVAAIGPSGSKTHVLRGGREAFTLDGSCTLEIGARVATCTGGAWFDLSSGAAPLTWRAALGAAEVAFDDGSAPSFTARCDKVGEKATLGPGGPRRDAATKGATTWRRRGGIGLAIDAHGVDVWDVTASRRLGRVATQAGSDGIFAAPPSGALLAVAGPSRGYELFRVADGASVAKVDLKAVVTSLGFRGERELVAATAKGSTGCCRGESATPDLNYPGGGKIHVLDATTGRRLRTFDGEAFDVDDAGDRLGVTTGHAAIVDVATGRSLLDLAGRGRLAALSPRGNFAIMVVSDPQNPARVTTTVVEVPSGRARVTIPAPAAGFAFDDGETRVVLAPMPIGLSLAASVVVYDLARDARSDVSLDEPGKNPFFTRAGAVVGYETAGGVAFVRLRDRRLLSVRGFAWAGACKLYATTLDGAFDGDGEGGLGVRLGDDLAASELLTSGPRFEAHRRRDLVASFLDGR